MFLIMTISVDKTLYYINIEASSLLSFSLDALNKEVTVPNHETDKGKADEEVQPLSAGNGQDQQEQRRKLPSLIRQLCACEENTQREGELVDQVLDCFTQLVTPEEVFPELADQIREMRARHAQLRQEGDQDSSARS